MHCGRFHARPISRREMLARCANGFGAVALATLMGESALAVPSSAPSPFAPRVPHYPAKAKSVIFLFMDGGPSQIDSFDPKPRLAMEHGQPIRMKTPPTQFANVGAVMQSPWKFRQYGQSGIPVSDRFPHVATCVDDLAIVRAMVSKSA